ncbi:SigE family RNA polymerase sigma factor [Streptomyces genisteinicus]|uniref:SigE family RNA polymerase sigma factor n=1 Tax=Streptomyces genisteinicus TaxID=2768068 RepID=A0A7H0HSG4_9ACTN|nr:SigE family RNA polymerase sigma factor [Streptomyces genisteinicus]QNP63480.1 SigE family RNA polymerase sigma factor [Streptomyces genisteinicus]
MKQDRNEEFAEFAAAAWPRLVRTATLLTGDFHEAEDLVQTTLAKVWSHFRRIPRDEIDLYVRRALINNNISRTRRRRVVHLLMPFLPESAHRVQPDHSDTAERRAVVLGALRALPARQRAVVVLRYWEDMGEHDIARVLNCSVGTVKTHARRALRTLRDQPLLAEARTPSGPRGTPPGSGTPSTSTGPASPGPSSPGAHR